MKALFSPGITAAAPSLGLLILRLFGAGMLFGHGWGKLMNFNKYQAVWQEHLGLGKTVELGLTVFAEVLCAALVMVGLATRLACIPLIICMAVAAFKVHGSAAVFFSPGTTKPFMELALAYLVPFSALLFTGAGKFSADAVIGK